MIPAFPPHSAQISCSIDIRSQVLGKAAFGSDFFFFNTRKYLDTFIHTHGFTIQSITLSKALQFFEPLQEGASARFSAF